MKIWAPPSWTSIRPGRRNTTAPRISSSQAAVASGSGLRRWTWSQVTIGMVVSLVFLGVACRDIHIERDGSILAVVFRHGHPRLSLVAAGFQYLSHSDATISGFVD